MPNLDNRHKPKRSAHKHKAQDLKPGWKPRTKEQEQARKFRSTAQWQKIRAIQLQKYPICMHPFCKFGTEATTVHHIKAIVDDQSAAIRLENCIPLCTKHHAVIEALERAGKPTQTIFEGWMTGDKAKMLKKKGE